MRGRFARLLLDPLTQRRFLDRRLIRLFARRRARALFDLAAGFVYSQTLRACLQCGLLEALRQEPRELRALAGSLDLSEETLDRLVEAAAALGLVRRLRPRRGGERRVDIATLGAALLGNPGLRAMIGHHDDFYGDLADPADLLRSGASAPERVAPGSGRVARLWGYAGRDDPHGLRDDAVAAYGELMARSQEMLADDVLRVAPLSRARRLLDVGGGEGVFAMAAAQRHPALQVGVFDLPAVCVRARDRLAAAGCSDRVSVHPGSFLTDPLPAGVDAVSLVRVLHDHDDAAARTILGRARAALPAGGRLIIAEPLAGACPGVDAYFALYFLAMGQGRLRSPETHRALLEAAGFERVQHLRTRLPMVVGVLVARAAP